ncbi:envelope glycoprotein [Folsomia candida]|uniref:Envelope glycoprotein n=1 Tax=Folsomia candida TaxID=158441 RepID=A0A226E3S5_FOLCA|nr:envelope glycoprotein [Folsomia candida]
MITGFILTGVYTIRTIIGISWYLTWPLRICIRVITQRRKNRTAIIPTTIQDDNVELGTPLEDLRPNYYATVSRGIRRHRNRLLLPGGLLIIAILINTCDSCSNFAMMSTSTTDCIYSHEQQRTCQVRINTRLAISPVGQGSCLHITDSRSQTLGTITIQTQSIVLRCQKELLYHIPRASVKCDSSHECCNILQGHECTYNSCSDFGINDTIKAFGSISNTLGWSSCTPVLPGCFWPQTHDCQSSRITIINPTGQTYSVYTCPEWVYAVKLKVGFHLGANVTTDTISFFAGKSASVHKVNFSLISASVPPIPALEECIISNGFKTALTPCNIRGELSTKHVGEIQCNTGMDATHVSNNCIGGFDLVQAQIDDNGIRCNSNLMDPELILQTNQLPLKLETGVLLPSDDSVNYEVSSSAILEIQMEGCYSCKGGSTLFIHAETDGASTTATIECQEVAYFTSIHITSVPTTLQLIMK